MHPFDIHLLSCLSFAKPRLPPDIVKIIFLKTSDERKLWRKLEQNPPFCGQSKSAAKRRAKRYERCVKCGNWSHEGNCSKNQTHSQSEYVSLIHEGAIRYRAEHPIRKESYVYYAVKKEISMMKNEHNIDVKLLSEIAAEQVTLRRGEIPRRISNHP